MEVTVKDLNFSFVEKDGSVEIITTQDDVVINTFVVEHEKKDTSKMLSKDVDDILNNSNFDSITNRTIDIKLLLSDLTGVHRKVQFLSMTDNQYDNYIKLLEMLSEDETMHKVFVMLINGIIDFDIDDTNYKDPKIVDLNKRFIPLVEKIEFNNAIRKFEKGKDVNNFRFRWFFQQTSVMEEIQKMEVHNVHKVVDILDTMTSFDRSSAIKKMKEYNYEEDSNISKIINATRYIA